MSTGYTHLPGSRASMPYVGIASFLKLPLVEVPAGAQSYDFLIVGIPHDDGASNRPGARFGPRAIRQASTLYSYEGSAELFDVESGRTILAGARVGDAGDVVQSPGGGAADRQAVAEAVAAIVAAGAIPVCLGGDHSVTASCLRGFASAAAAGHRADGTADAAVAKGAAAMPPYLVHLDAHMDFDSYLPDFAHGTPVRQAVEEGTVAGVTQIGIRGLNSGMADWEEARGRGVRVITRQQLADGGIGEVLRSVPAGGPFYLSIDIDAFDPSIAPGTGTPEPGGLLYQEGRALLRALAAHGRVVGIDLVEVNPLFDHGEITAVLASRLLLDLMGAVWDERRAEAGR